MHKILSIILIFVWFECANQRAAARPPTKEKNEKVVIAQFGKEKFLLYLPLYIAMEEGMFAKRGIDIDLRFVGNDDQVFAAVTSGDAMFGIGDPVLAAISKDTGGPGKVIATMVAKLGLSGYTKRKDVPDIDKPEDVKGFKIGTPPAPSAVFNLVTQFVKKNGFDKSGPTLVPIAIGGEIAALEAGTVDMVIGSEPTVLTAESKGCRVNFFFDQFVDPQVITGVTTLDSTIRLNPAAVQAFTSGLQEAMIKLKADQQMPFRVAKKLFPDLSEGEIRNSLSRMMRVGVYPFFVRIDDELWQRTLRSRLESGELKRPQKTYIAVNSDFADQAAKDLGLNSF